MGNFVSYDPEVESMTPGEYKQYAKERCRSLYSQGRRVGWGLTDGLYEYPIPASEYGGSRRSIQAMGKFSFEQYEALVNVIMNDGLKPKRDVFKELDIEIKTDIDYTLLNDQLAKVEPGNIVVDYEAAKDLAIFVK